MSAAPIDVAVNPNNTAQRYILWTNGRIDAIGGAPPITQITDWQASWVSRFEPPGRAIHITNWATGAGWTLDYRGGFNTINGATHASVGLGDNPNEMAGIPITASPSTRLYRDWHWNPSGNGQGYVLDHYGKLYAFGGATAPTRTGTRFSTPLAIRLQMQWSPDKRAITMDVYGRRWIDFAAVITGATSFPMPKFGAIRDFQVVNWANGAGYLLDLYGKVWQIGGLTQAGGYPYNNGGDNARCLAVLSSTDPVRFWEVWSGGQQWEFVSSTPPTVVAGGSDPVSPATTVTDTTRPDLLWDYSDPQDDSQAAWQLLVFTQAFVNAHTMTDPLVWKASALVNSTGVDPKARGVDCPVDLSNSTYRMYIRVKDTAGQWSAWSNRGWTQNVPAPVTPTGLTATANQTLYSVALSVTATTGGSANLIRFQYSDDGGTTWADVRGAGAVTLAATTTATDWDPPLGLARQYGAVAYAVDPHVASARSGTATATITAKTYALTAVNDPSLGGRFWVQKPVSWTRRFSGGVFEGLGADYPTVISDGRPKARRATLRLVSLDAATWAKIEALLESDSVLVFRDPRGQVVYCRPNGDWSQDMLGAPVQFSDETELPLVEVAAPVTAS